MKRIAAFLASSALLAAPAMAGTLADPVVEPVIQPAPVVSVADVRDWTGPYVGLGIASSNFNFDYNNGALEESNSGMNWSIFAGYTFDMGGFVLGGELEYVNTNVNWDIPQGPTIDVVNSLRLKARGGVAMGDALFYGVLGLGQLTIDFDGALGSGTETGSGYLYGLGAEMYVTDNFTIGAELLRHEYRDFPNGAGDPLDIGATTIGLRGAFRF